MAARFDPAAWLGRDPVDRDDYREASRRHAREHTPTGQPIGTLAWRAYWAADGAVALAGILARLTTTAQRDSDAGAITRSDRLSQP